MKYLTLFKRVKRHDRYREIGIVEADDPLSARDKAISRLDDGQKRAWYESRIIIKMHVLGEGYHDEYDVLHQEDLNNLEHEAEMYALDQIETPEGGWPKGSDADRL